MSFKRPVLVPELYVSDLPISLTFYVEVLGFSVVYSRPEEGFVTLERGGACIMLEETPSLAIASDEEFTSGQWRTAALSKPFGRGMNLEIRVSDLSELASRIQSYGHQMLLAPHRKSHRTPSGAIDVLRCLIEDPDGYLLRFYELVATRDHDG